MTAVLKARPTSTSSSHVLGPGCGILNLGLLSKTCIKLTLDDECVQETLGHLRTQGLPMYSRQTLTAGFQAFGCLLMGDEIDQVGSDGKWQGHRANAAPARLVLYGDGRG